MSKKNKAAKTAATTAAKPAETAKVDNTAKAQVTEKGKGDAPVVDAPASTAKEALTAPQPKKEEKPQENKSKTEKQPAQKGAEQQSKKKQQPKDKTPLVLAEEVTEEVKLGKAIGVPMSNESLATAKMSSTDAKAQLVNYGYNRFINNQEFKDSCPEAYAHTARAIDTVWLLAMIDVRNEIKLLNAAGRLIVKVEEDQVMPLKEVADMLGIEFATPKAITGPDGEKQLAFDFTDPETKVPPVLEEGAKPQPKVEPDMDYDKVGSDHEKIVEVLDFLLHSDRNLVIALDKTIEWYRGLCIHNAAKSEDKLLIDAKPVNEWIEEIFGIVKPTGLLRGLGRTVYLRTKHEGSPVAAHCLLHGQLPSWSDDDIARMLQVLIKENFRYNLESDLIDLKGEPMKTKTTMSPTEDKAIQSILGNLGVKYVDDLMADYSASVPEGATDEQLAEIKDKRANARKIISMVKANYYRGSIEPTTEQYRFAVGKIINTYRQPMDKLAEFDGDYPILTGEYPPKAKEEAKTEAPAEEKKS